MIIPGEITQDIIDPGYHAQSSSYNFPSMWPLYVQEGRSFKAVILTMAIPYRLIYCFYNQSVDAVDQILLRFPPTNVVTCYMSQDHVLLTFPLLIFTLNNFSFSSGLFSFHRCGDGKGWQGFSSEILKEHLFWLLVSPWWWLATLSSPYLMDTELWGLPLSSCGCPLVCLYCKSCSAVLFKRTNVLGPRTPLHPENPISNP